MEGTRSASNQICFMPSYVVLIGAVLIPKLSFAILTSLNMFTGETTEHPCVAPSLVAAVS